MASTALGRTSAEGSAAEVVGRATVIEAVDNRARVDVMAARERVVLAK